MVKHKLKMQGLPELVNFENHTLSGRQTVVKIAACNDIEDQQYHSTQFLRGWSGGAMVLGKLPVPGRPTHLD